MLYCTTGNFEKLPTQLLQIGFVVYILLERNNMNRPISIIVHIARFPKLLILSLLAYQIALNMQSSSGELLEDREEPLP